MTPEPEDPGRRGEAGLALTDEPLDGRARRERGDGPLAELRTSRRSPGRRTRRRRARRRRLLLRAVLGLAGAALVVAGAIAGIRALPLGSDGDPAASEPQAAQPTSAAGGADVPSAVVLATFDETRPGSGASQIVVLAIDEEEGTILLVPAATLADVPGHGLLQLGRAYGFGQAGLLDASLDNLLGVDFDHVVGVSRQGWASLFTRIGGLTVDVPERLVERREDGSSQVRFEAGEQFLDGPRVAEYLTFREADESELESLPRIQQVLVGLLDRVAAEPQILDEIFADGAPMLDTPDPAPLRALLERLAALRRDGQVATVTLPVSPIGSGEGNSYRIDRDRVEELVAARLGASVPDGGEAGARTLQVLNGNGTPGIGQEVAQILIPEGYQVLLTGNADSFDHPETRIVVYSEDEGDIAAARRIRDLLGVGVVERSEAPQSVVDVTVVVGDDFPPDDL